jgi:hypothetical protein
MARYQRGIQNYNSSGTGAAGMSNFEIQIEENKENFRPGEEIRGIVLWNFDKMPSPLELTLFWRTEGKGTQDIGVIDTINIETAGPPKGEVSPKAEASGQKEFKFTAPTGPCSFSGTLISIIWGLELVTANGKDSLRKDLVISPTGQTIICKETFPEKTSWSLHSGGSNL